MATIDQHQHDGLVPVLAGMPDVLAQLLADHIPDSAGRCMGCTKGGTGYPSATHPCGLHRLAALALTHRERTIAETTAARLNAARTAR